MRPDMNQQNERCTDLYEAILRLENLDECIRFFDDLCAVTELRTMEQRYAVAGMGQWGFRQTDYRPAGAAGHPEKR